MLLLGKNATGDRLMNNTVFAPAQGLGDETLRALRSVLERLPGPFAPADKIGIKLHWGERGNKSYLSPAYAREVVRWLRDLKTEPFVFDTTVLYSGGRRTGKAALHTAAEHGYTADFLGCPVLIGDGEDGRDILEIPAGFKHFPKVQVAAVLNQANGFVIFSHFKGHLASGFGGAIKNISMGFASRAQKQRMHSEARPVLNQKKCNRCGICVEVCPVQAGSMENEQYPQYNLKNCIGCAQCIASCPEVALRILWETDGITFQEKLIETAAAVWARIREKTILINALINVTTECDCLSGSHPRLAPDAGFLGGSHPVAVDEESIKLIGAEKLTAAHASVPWRRQLSYAREIGFTA